MSYLITFGLVAFTQYSILPWILIYFRTRKFESWAQVVTLYGLLLSTMNVGVFSGRGVASYMKQLSKLSYASLFLLLATSYAGLVFVNRMFFIILLFWLVGFSGGMLTSFYLAVDSCRPVAFQRKASDCPDHLDWNIICFIFSTLLTGFLYNNGTDAEFPCFSLAVLWMITCATSAIYFLFLNYSAQSKVKVLKGPNPAGSKGNNVTIPGLPSRAVTTSDRDLDGQGVDYAGEVPLNFLSACYGDLAKARKMYGRMLAWRKKYNVDEIFAIPQPCFDNVVRYYPHAIHGHSLDGCTVVYELLGKGNAGALKATGISMDELVWHFNLRNEHIFKRLATDEGVQEAVSKAVPGAIQPTPFPYKRGPIPTEGVMKTTVPRLMAVIDVQGISMSSITTDVLAFIQKNGETIDLYYPEQVARLVVCKAPRWFSAIWSVIARVLPEAVQKKVDILYDAKGLDKYIHPSQRPAEYDGTDVPLGSWYGHRSFLQLSEDWKKQEEDYLALHQKDASAVGGKENKASTMAGNGTKKADKSVGESSEKRGIFGWIRSKLSGGDAQREAFLGEKNTYRYNAATGRWELDHEEGEEEEEEGEFENSAKSLMASRPSENALRGMESSGSGNGHLSVSTGAALPRSLSQGALSPKSAARKYGEKETTPRSLSARSASSANLKKKSPAVDDTESVEEHGLLLAIHAAHYASKMRTLSPATLEEGQSQADESDGLLSTIGQPRNQAQGTGTSSSIAHLSKLPAQLFLVVLSIFLLASAIQISVVTCIPVWLASPLRTGGLGYGVRDLALLMSSSGLLLLHLQALIGPRMVAILQASPVRALRISMGIFVLSSLLLLFYMRQCTLPIEDILHHHSDTESPVDSSHLGYSIHLHSSLWSGEMGVLQRLGNVLPSISTSALLVPSTLIAVVIASAFFSRRAATALLQLSLASSLSSPATVRRALMVIVDIFGPFLAALQASLVYNAHLRFPMDSSFFLSLASSGALLTYIVSLLIDVHFRGDFGVMADYQDLKAWTGSNDINGVHPPLRESFRKNRDENSSSSGRRLLSRNRDSQTGDRLQDLQDRSEAKHLPAGAAGRNDSWDPSHCVGEEDHVLTIPLGDLQLLFSGISAQGYAYGGKLHNLKEDFKDV